MGFPHQILRGPIWRANEEWYMSSSAFPKANISAIWPRCVLCVSPPPSQLKGCRMCSLSAVASLSIKSHWLRCVLRFTNQVHVFSTCYKVDPSSINNACSTNMAVLCLVLKLAIWGWSLSLESEPLESKGSSLTPAVLRTRPPTKQTSNFQTWMHTRIKQRAHSKYRYLSPNWRMLSQWVQGNNLGLCISHIVRLTAVCYMLIILRITEVGVR